MEIPEAYPAEDFATATSGICDVEIIDDCDHFYRNKEDVVTRIVKSWITKTIMV